MRLTEFVKRLSDPFQHFKILTNLSMIFGTFPVNADWQPSIPLISHSVVLRVLWLISKYSFKKKHVKSSLSFYRKTFITGVSQMYVLTVVLSIIEPLRNINKIRACAKSIKYIKNYRFVHYDIQDVVNWNSLKYLFIMTNACAITYFQYKAALFYNGTTGFYHSFPMWVNTVLMVQLRSILKIVSVLFSKIKTELEGYLALLDSKLESKEVRDLVRLHNLTGNVLEDVNAAFEWQVLISIMTVYITVVNDFFAILSGTSKQDRTVLMALSILLFIVVIFWVVDESMAITQEVSLTLLFILIYMQSIL